MGAHNEGRLNFVLTRVRAHFPVAGRANAKETAHRREFPPVCSLHLLTYINLLDPSYLSAILGFFSQPRFFTSCMM